MVTLKQLLLKLKAHVLPLGIICASLVFFFVMVATRPSPPSRERVEHIPEVPVTTFEKIQAPLRLRQQGVTQSRRQVEIIPRVSGEIIYVNPKVETGVPIGKGEVLFRIDPRDYELNLAGAQSQLKSARMQLRMEEEEQDIARRQWDLYQNRNPEATAGELTLRTPQLEQARASYEAAEATVQQAQLNLERTVIRAPFAAVSRGANADVGQFVSGSSLATIQGTEYGHIPVNISSHSAEILGLEKEDSVQIYFHKTDSTAKRTGSVAGVSRTLDRESNTREVLIELTDPLGLKGGEEILMGRFVSVEFTSRAVDSYYRIPRNAVFEGDMIRVVEEGRLQFRPVTIAHWDGNDALVTEGISPEDSVVIGAMDITIEGMELKAVQQ
ncbi:MAG: efflux RND transporter periplasmic adaptor subunit [Fibrobacterota bacterium]